MLQECALGMGEWLIEIPFNGNNVPADVVVTGQAFPWSEPVIAFATDQLLQKEGGSGRLLMKISHIYFLFFRCWISNNDSSGNNNNPSSSQILFCKTKNSLICILNQLCQKNNCRSHWYWIHIPVLFTMYYLSQTVCIRAIVIAVIMTVSIIRRKKILVMILMMILLIIMIIVTVTKIMMSEW